jgi:hypothetical protein
MNAPPLPPDLRWVGFDMDDTLHCYKRASGRAEEAVFGEIERQLGIASVCVGEEELPQGLLATRLDLVAARPARSLTSSGPADQPPPTMRTKRFLFAWRR